MSILDDIRTRLAILEPSHLDIQDESAAHIGHAGAQAGGGHYRVTIVSAQFAQRAPLARHRMVYDALGALMKREIHAMSIMAKTPDET